MQEQKFILGVLADGHMTAGEQLRIWRKAKGMTQEELAEAVGIGPAYMSNLERDVSPNTRSGMPRASADLCKRFAHVLGVSAKEVLDIYGHATQPEKPKTLAELLGRLAELGVSHVEFLDDEAIRNATPEDLADVLRAVEITLEVTLRNRHVRPPKRDRSIHPASP